METKWKWKQITIWNVAIVSGIKTFIHYFKIIVIKINLVSLVVDRNFHIGICYITSNNGRRSHFVYCVSVKVKFCFLKIFLHLDGIMIKLACLQRDCSMSICSVNNIISNMYFYILIIITKCLIQTLLQIFQFL